MVLSPKPLYAVTGVLFTVQYFSVLKSEFTKFKRKHFLFLFLPTTKTFIKKDSENIVVLLLPKIGKYGNDITRQKKSENKIT